MLVAAFASFLSSILWAGVGANSTESSSDSYRRHSVYLPYKYYYVCDGSDNIASVGDGEGAATDATPPNTFSNVPLDDANQSLPRVLNEAEGFAAPDLTVFSSGVELIAALCSMWRRH